MDDLYSLNEIISNNLVNGEQINRNAAKHLAEIVSGGGYIGMAQINPMVGDIEYNAKKIAGYIKVATEIGLESVVFPELALMGYPIEDTIDRHPHIVSENIKWLQGIAKITKNTIAIVGFVENRKSLNGKKFYNSLAVLQNGKIQGIVRNSLLPTYSEFNDYRYIEPSDVVGVQAPDLLGTGITIKQN